MTNSCKIMKNVKLTVEYDGSNYSGFQRQANANTVQSELEKAIEKIVNHEITLYCAGRTDAGVHAIGQVCNFFTSSPISEYALTHAINSRLPRDISCSQISFVDENFNARHSAKLRHYKYCILNRQTRSAVNGRYMWHIRGELNLESMRDGAKYFIGTYDFRAFSRHVEKENYVRSVYSLEICKSDDIITIEICANAYLRSMVRNIVGTLVEIGLGKRASENVKELIDLKDRRLAGICAPANGLFLKSVEY